MEITQLYSSVKLNISEFNCEFQSSVTRVKKVLAFGAKIIQDNFTEYFQSNQRIKCSGVFMIFH